MTSFIHSGSEIRIDRVCNGNKVDGIGSYMTALYKRFKYGNVKIILLSILMYLKIASTYIYNGYPNLKLLFRSSRQEVFCKKGALRSFAKFTGKHVCQSLLFNIVASLRPATLLKKRLWHRCFPVNFVKFLRTPFLQNTSGRLLLHVLNHLIGAMLR